MNFDEVHNTSLLPLEDREYHKDLKSFVLFTQIDDNKIIGISKETMSISLNYLGKLN